jgi:hypothetical protein
MSAAATTRFCTDGGFVGEVGADMESGRLVRRSQEAPPVPSKPRKGPPAVKSGRFRGLASEAMLTR